MRRFRISIAGLLAGVALAGLAIAALTHPSPLAANAFYTLTLATLTIALLAAVYHRGLRRAFWVGFAACGWAYFLAEFGPAPVSDIGDNLVTTTILDIIYPYTIPALARAAGLQDDLDDASEQYAARSMRAGAHSRLQAKRGVILAGAFGGKAGPPTPPPTPWQILTRPDRMTRFNQGSPRLFRLIGHSLFCLAFATLGGVLARHFKAAGDREVTSQI